MLKSIAYSALAALGIAFVVNVFLVAFGAPDVLQPFYWTSIGVVQARRLASVAGDLLGQLYIQAAYWIDRFVAKLGPAFKQSFAGLWEILVAWVYVAGDFVSQLLTTLRESQVYAYIVSPSTLFVLGVVATLVFAFPVLHYWWRPAWWVAFMHNLLGTEPTLVEETPVAAAAVAPPSLRSRRY